MIHRAYRDDIGRNLADSLRTSVLKNKDGDFVPVINMSNMSYIILRHGALYVVALAGTNANAMLALRFLTEVWRVCWRTTYCLSISLTRTLHRCAAGGTLQVLLQPGWQAPHRRDHQEELRAGLRSPRRGDRLRAAPGSDSKPAGNGATTSAGRRQHHPCAADPLRALADTYVCGGGWMDCR